MSQPGCPFPKRPEWQPVPVPFTPPDSAHMVAISQRPAGATTQHIGIVTDAPSGLAILFQGASGSLDGQEQALALAASIENYHHTNGQGPETAREFTAQIDTLAQQAFGHVAVLRTVGKQHVMLHFGGTPDSNDRVNALCLGYNGSAESYDGPTIPVIMDTAYFGRIVLATHLPELPKLVLHRTRLHGHELAAHAAMARAETLAAIAQAALILGESPDGNDQRLALAVNPSVLHQPDNPIQ